MILCSDPVLPLISTSVHAEDTSLWEEVVHDCEHACAEDLRSWNVWEYSCLIKPYWYYQEHPATLDYICSWCNRVPLNPWWKCFLRFLETWYHDRISIVVACGCMLFLKTQGASAAERWLPRQHANSAFGSLSLSSLHSITCNEEPLPRVSKLPFQLSAIPTCNMQTRTRITIPSTLHSLQTSPRCHVHQAFLHLSSVLSPEDHHLSRCKVECHWGTGAHAFSGPVARESTCIVNRVVLRF